jgi:hypothetical protein
MRIFKYPLRVTDHQSVPLPLGARILSVQFQDIWLSLWAAVDPKEALTEARHIRIYGTGHELDSSGRFITTVQQGSLVWHIFEEAP